MFDQKSPENLIKKKKKKTLLNRGAIDEFHKLVSTAI